MWTGRYNFFGKKLEYFLTLSDILCVGICSAICM